MTMTVEKCRGCEFAARQRDVSTGKPGLRCEITGETLKLSICVKESTPPQGKGATTNV